MSDDFDREAEKEKLRRQFEEEEKARQSTQHMSELLLKGATMTNMHCDECGDPIFRDGGREFCPTCQRPVGAEAEDATDAESDPGSAVETTDGAAVDPDAETGSEIDVEPGIEEDGAADPGTEPRPSATPTETAGSTATGGASRPVATPGNDLDEARGALVRKLTTLARQAEATDDVGRARTLLAATREAAEALAAVESIER